MADKAIKKDSVKYKVSDSFQASHNNIIALLNNRLDGVRLQLKVPDGFRYNPQTGEFVAPPVNKSEALNK